MSNYGPKKPLNWREPTFAKAVKRVTTLEEKLDIHYRDGTPPTRGGASWGAPSGLRPPIPSKLNPPLIIKAVLAPVKYGEEGKPQFARKRGPDGKFVEAESTGSESTAQDDAQRNERESKLSEHRSHDKLVDTKLRAQAVSRGESVKNPSVKDNKEKDGKVDKALGSQVPGVSSAMPIDTVNDPVSKQIGVTKTGNPIFDDPHHSEHTDFTPDDHQDAAQANATGAQQAMAAGDQAGAMRMQNNASIHDSMANDTSNPSTRFLNQLTTDNGQAPSMDDLPQDDLSALMGGTPPTQDPMAAQTATQPPGMQSTPQDGLSTLMGGPTAPMPPPSAAPTGVTPPNVPPVAHNTAGAEPDFRSDALSNFVDPGADKNKPTMNPPAAGPAPGMINSQTGTGVGPQTDSSQFAGTMSQPQSPQDEMSPVSPDTSDTTGAVDLDQLFGNGEDGDSDTPPMGAPGEESDDSDSMPNDPADDKPSFGGKEPASDDSADESDEEDKDKLKVAMNKALVALSRLI
jgi:hypothetical protein